MGAAIRGTSMNTVTVEAPMAADLTRSGELVAIRDAAGTVIGFFAPAKAEYAREYAEGAARTYSIWGAEGPPRHLNTPGELIAYLEAREKSK
jgi:hypothetical protein